MDGVEEKKGLWYTLIRDQLALTDLYKCPQRKEFLVPL